MARKRKRTAWLALSEPRPKLYARSDTLSSRDPASGALHISPAPASSLPLPLPLPDPPPASASTPSSSSPPAPVPPSPPKGPTSALQPPPQPAPQLAALLPQQKQQRQQQQQQQQQPLPLPQPVPPQPAPASKPAPPGPSPSPSCTPPHAGRLVLTASEIAEAKEQLGFTPGTPSSALHYLDPDTEADARRLLSSTQRYRRAHASSASDSNASVSTADPSRPFASPPRPGEEDAGGKLRARYGATTAAACDDTAARANDVAAAMPDGGTTAAAKNATTVTTTAATTAATTTTTTNFDAVQQHLQQQRTPRNASRRLSTGSAVTPIPLPLGLGSPDHPPSPPSPHPPSLALRTPHQPAPPPRLHRAPHAPAPNGHTLAQVQAPASTGNNINNNPLARTAPTHPVDSPITPAPRLSSAAADPGAGPPLALFTTGKGAPLPPPSAAARRRAGSLFSTGAGKPLPPPSAAALARGTALFQNASDLPKNAGSRAAASHPPFLNPATATTPPQPQDQKQPVPTPPQNTARALFTTGKGTPLAPPSASATRRAATLFTSGKGAPLTAAVPSPGSAAAASVAAITSAAAGPESNPAPAAMQQQVQQLGKPLFTTGRGAVLPFTTPSPMQTGFLSTSGNVSMPMPNTPARLNTPQSVTPGSTNPVQMPLFRSGATNKIVTPPALALGLGSGKAVAASAAAATPGTAGTSIRHGGDGTGPNLLMTSRGNTNISTTVRRGVMNGAATPGPKSRAPGITPRADSLRKTLFREAPRRTPARAPASGLKTTPFKRPRPLVRPQHGGDSATVGATTPKPPQNNVPKFTVPQLLRDGGLRCGKCPHGAGHQAMRGADSPVTVKAVDVLPPPSLSFLEKPGCLQACMSFTFSRSRFGPVASLPDEVVASFQVRTATEIGVAQVEDWVSSMFSPAKRNKPGTTVGSKAWTRLGYALAVLKLATLDRERSSRRTEPVRNQRRSDGTVVAATKQKKGSFLTLANVVREMLRRLQVEWHDGRQPPLLRMMRRDNSPAARTVLRVIDVEDVEGVADGRSNIPGGSDVFSSSNSTSSSFSLPVGRRLVLLLSDGWYVARAILDHHVEDKVWGGQIRVGDRVRIVGSTLVPFSGEKLFVFGDGDETANDALKLHINGVTRVKREGSSAVKLGVQKSFTWTRSLRQLHDDGGVCVGLSVQILKRYPPYYLETITTEDENGDEHEEKVWRRDYPSPEENVRAVTRGNDDGAAPASTKSGENDGGERKETTTRRTAVISVHEVLVCGQDDAVEDISARKVIRVYNGTEATHSAFQREGRIVHLTTTTPRKGVPWVCKPGHVIEVRRQPRTSAVTVAAEMGAPVRVHATVRELRDGSCELGTGDEFDAAFYIVHVGDLVDMNGTTVGKGKGGGDDDDNDDEDGGGDGDENKNNLNNNKKSTNKKTSAARTTRSRAAAHTKGANTVNTKGMKRFIYVCDQPDTADLVVALELRGPDAADPPRALAHARRGDVVVVRNARLVAVSEQLGVIHAEVTLRTEVIAVAVGLHSNKSNGSSTSSKRQQHRRRGKGTGAGGWAGAGWRRLGEESTAGGVREAARKLAEGSKATEARLDILGEAVVSFANGAHSTVGAYFRGSQEEHDAVA